MTNRVSLLEAIRHWFWQWIVRRAPRAKKVVLRHKSIYVLPTRQGLLFLVVTFVMWLLGTNYQNNLILATAFLLVSMMIVSIIHAFRNLSGLEFHAVSARSVFAGEHAEFAILVACPSRGNHQNVQITLDPSLTAVVDLVTNREQHIKLVEQTRARGWFSPGRILVKSIYPLGLVRAWSWVHVDMQALIYPAPLVCEEPPLAQVSDHGGDIVARENPEDFYGLTTYQAGMPLSRVAWKQYARGAGLHLKEYVGYQSQDVWLDWESLRGLDTETRLSRLCYWVLQLSKSPGQYGLRLPGQMFDLGSGDGHRNAILRALALYRDGATLAGGDHNE